MSRAVRWVPVLVALGAGALSAAWALTSDRANVDVADRWSPAANRVAAPGRVEGRSETVEVGSGADGVLDAVLVKEGDRVSEGQIVARVECRDLEQDERGRRAALLALQHHRARLIHGGREDERAEAQASVEAAEATASAAAADRARAEDLWTEKVIPRAEYDRLIAADAVARAAVTAARSRVSAVRRDPLIEELRELDARIAEAEAGIQRAGSRVARCTVKAPIAGEIVRVHRRAGETVSLLRGEPIVSLADTSRLRVRAELEETDVARVRVGDTAIVSAVGLGQRRLRGRVVEIGRQMGRKGVLTGDPAEKRDRDVLEMIVELETPAQPIVIGLRVTVIVSGGDL